VKLYEYQAKEIFARHGIPVPRGQVAETPEQAAAAAERLGGRVVVKAQVHAGGRGKGGFVKVVNTPAEAREYAEWMLGRTFKGLVVKRALVEEPLDIKTEYYLSATIDRMTKRPIMIGSAEGGVEIEQVAEETPDAIAKAPIDTAYGPFDFQLRQFMTAAGFDPTAHRGIAPIARKVYEILVAADASLVEINPLVITGDGKVMAADAKFDVDDNALFRQKDLAQYREESEEDPIEAEAHRRGVTYVRLDGDIGIIGNGAGLVMTTLDLVTRAGGRPANFLDIGGGARAESVREAIEIVLMDPNVKGILFNIFGGITRGDEVAKGILAGTSTMDIKVPIVVRMEGTLAEEGRKLLEGSNLVAASGPVEAAEKIIELARGR
jgi:succinyl-CoA synthetase beta subunit